MPSHDAAPSGIANRLRTLGALALVALIGTALAPVAAAEDTVTLTNGNEIQGKIVEEDDEKIVMEIYTDDEGGFIRQTFKKEQVLSIERDKFDIDIDLSGQGEGLQSLFGTLPQNWRERWSTVTEESSTTGMIFLYVVTAAWFIFIPALLLHAGSAIVGVADPTYSRAVMCIVLVLVFTILFAWLANRVGWLITLKISDMNFLYMALLFPMYIGGQTVLYKWSYVTDWQKAIPLVSIGLLVSLITGAAFLVLLSILA